MQEFVFEGKVAYITDVVNRSDCAVFKRGFCTSEVFPYHDEYKELAEKFMKEDRREFLPKGLSFLDLAYYGELENEGNIFLSNWYDKYRFVDCEEFKIYRDATKRFGNAFTSHSEQTLIPFIEIIDEDIIMIGIYSPDIEKVIAKERLEDICYDENEFRIHSQNITEKVRNVIS